MSFHDFKWMRRRITNQDVWEYVDTTYPGSRWRAWHYFRLRHPYIMSFTAGGLLILLLFFTWMGLT